MSHTKGIIRFYGVAFKLNEIPIEPFKKTFNDFTISTLDTYDNPQTIADLEEPYERLSDIWEFFNGKKIAAAPFRSYQTDAEWCEWDKISECLAIHIPVTFEMATPYNDFYMSPFQSMVISHAMNKTIDRYFKKNVPEYNSWEYFIKQFCDEHCLSLTDKQIKWNSYYSMWN